MTLPTDPPDDKAAFRRRLVERVRKAIAAQEAEEAAAAQKARKPALRCLEGGAKK